jgi:hypothetical protein
VYPFHRFLQSAAIFWNVQWQWFLLICSLPMGLQIAGRTTGQGVVFETKKGTQLSSQDMVWQQTYKVGVGVHEENCKIKTREPCGECRARAERGEKD